MKLLPTLLGLAAIARGQYYIPQDEISSTSGPSSEIDCSVLEDGNYAGGCFSTYVSCAAGIAYSMECPADLLFDDVRNECVYPLDCGVPASTPALDSTTVTMSSSPSSTSTASSTIDCSQLKDGFYSEGCTEHYTVCTYGVAATAVCPSGLVYDMITNSCEYPDFCEQIRSARPMTIEQYPVHKTKESSTISTSNANDSPFDCLNKLDGDYALDCSNDYVSCFAGMAVSRRCPLGLLFSDSTKRCQLSCELLDATTIIQDTTTITTPTSLDTATISSNSHAPVTGPSDSCDNGQVVSLGNCSSKFQRCRCKHWISAVCPGSSVFDELSGLCLYSLPRCYTDFVPTDAPPVSYPTASTGYEESRSTYDASPVYQGAPQTYLPHWEHDQLLVSNPFFTQKKRYRHGRKHGRSDRVRKMGKLRAASKSLLVDDRSSYVTDAFRGPYEPYIQSGSWSVFPHSRVHRMRIDQAMNAMSDEEETTPLDEDEIIEVASTTVSSTRSLTPTLPVTGLPLAIRPGQPLVTNADVEGSGQEDLNMPVQEENISRHKRSYGSIGSSNSASSNDMHKFCRGVASSTLVSVGFCRQEFIFCRSYVANIAGCPIGDLYDEAKNSCVPANICGVSDSDVCSTTTSDGSQSTDVTSFATSDYSDASIDTCADGYFGVLASQNCSNTYILCDNGIEIVMSCPEGLFYNNANGKCDYVDAVSLCVGVAVLQTESSSTLISTTDSLTHAPYIPIQNTLGTVTAAPYVPLTSTSSVPQVASGPCGRIANGFVAVSPCATSFIVCFDGRALTQMNCPANLVFNEAAGYCEYPTAVPECSSFDPVLGSTPPSAYSQKSEDAVTTARPLTSFTSSLKSPCVDVVDGYIPVEMCSNSYISCVDGETTATMYCSAGLVFDERLIACVRPEDLDECSVSVSTEPISTVGYPDVTSTTITTTAATKSPTVEPVQYLHPVPVVSEVSCPAPLSSAKVCSPEYTLCSNGIDYELTCPPPLVFNRDRQVCDYKEFVSECAESVSTTSTTTSESTTSMTSTSVVSKESSAFVYEEVTESSKSVPITASTLLQCSYEEDAPGISIGFCSNQYAMCQADGTLKTVNCELGLLFDAAISKCVPAAECGRPAKVEFSSTTAATTTSAPNAECSKLDSGSGLVAVSSCSAIYLSCNQGAATIMRCPHELVFSKTKGQCMRRQNVHECRNIVYVSVSANHSSFCVGREDNLYRDPQNCEGVVQCHGGNLFAATRCSSGLVFNDKTKQCDYRQNVDGCEEERQHLQNDISCNGAAHGAYVASKSNCSIFYRCVWDKLVKMACPTGTVFNPTLSVCDWPSSVPKCASGPLATDIVRPY